MARIVASCAATAIGVKTRDTSRRCQVCSGWSLLMRMSLPGVETLDGHAVPGEERRGVEAGGEHVVVARQRPEPDLLVVVHGRFVAQPPVHRERVVLDRRRIRVVLHGCRSRLVAVLVVLCIHYEDGGAQATGPGGAIVASRPMEGVRILEVAQFTFTPSAGAVLADWGADVVKVEHATTGDAQARHGRPERLEGRQLPPDHRAPQPRASAASVSRSNTRARSRSSTSSPGTATCSSPNFLPDARERLRIDLDDIRAVNPDIIYVRGTAFGARGPKATRGGYDATAYWARGGHAAGVRPPDYDGVLGMPGPAYGDSLGGMTIAGGIAAALLARDRTGEPSVLDVSLLGLGLWANTLAVDISLANGEPWPGGSMGNPPEARTNPGAGPVRTSDGRYLYLAMIQVSKFWADFCRHLGREDMIDDERWNTPEKLLGERAGGGRDRARGDRVEAVRLLGRPLPHPRRPVGAGAGHRRARPRPPGPRERTHRRDHRRRRRQHASSSPTPCSSTRRRRCCAGHRSSPSTPTRSCASSGSTTSASSRSRSTAR